MSGERRRITEKVDMRKVIAEHDREASRTTARMSRAEIAEALRGHDVQEDVARGRAGAS